MSRKYDPEEQKLRIGRCLFRLRKMRELGAPRLIVRTEQLMLWAMRQQRKYATYTAMSKMPGWRVNYEAFVLIHHSDLDPQKPN